MTAPTSKAVLGPGVPPKEYEALDRPGAKQTMKDLPVVILGTALGYALGEAAARMVVKRYAQPGAPDWLKYAPRIVGAAHAIALPVLQHKLQQKMKERRDAARGGTNE